MTAAIGSGFGTPTYGDLSTVMMYCPAGSGGAMLGGGRHLGIGGLLSGASAHSMYDACVVNEERVSPIGTFAIGLQRTAWSAGGIGPDATGTYGARKSPLVRYACHAGELWQPGCGIALPVSLSITRTTRTAAPAVMVVDATSRCEVTRRGRAVGEAGVVLCDGEALGARSDE